MKRVFTAPTNDPATDLSEHAGPLPPTLAELVARAGHLRWCHWKSNVRLDLSISGKTDLDLLVHPEDAAAFHATLSELGFVPFHAMRWGDYPGVSNWLGADPETGILFHIHLHDHLLTGMKSAKEQELPWTDLVLDARIPDLKMTVPIIPRALEVHILLAREVAKSSRPWRIYRRLRGKQPISGMERDEMAFLLSEAAHLEVDRWGNRLWGESAWQRARTNLAEDVWGTSRGLRAICNALKPVLRQWRRPLFPAMLQRTYGVLLKRIIRLRKRIDPTTATGMRFMTRAPMIAFVGSDGAGKSTLTSDLRNWLGWKADCQLVYFGSKGPLYIVVKRWLGRWRPIIAATKRGSSSPSVSVGGRGSLWRAFRVVCAAHFRLRTLRRAERMMARGQIVIADRFPQFEVFGIHDGPSGIDPNQFRGFQCLLYRLEEKINARLRCAKPDLVVRLLVPVDVALRRKPNHDRDSIERKVEINQTLSFDGATNCRSG